MLTLGVDQLGPYVLQTATRPLLYLDHFALIDLTRDSALKVRERVLARIGAGGTLAISWAGMIEVANQKNGRSMDAIRAFLHEVGHAFVIIDPEPRGVAVRAAKMPRGDVAAAFDRVGAEQRGSDLKWAPGPVSAADAIAAITAAPHDARRRLADNLKLKFTCLLRRAQQRGREEGWAPVVPENEPDVLKCWGALATTIAQEHSTAWEPNDGADLLHAIVPPAYCDFVLLDDAWKRRVAQTPSPPRRAQLFAGRKGEFDAFLDALESWPAPPPEAK